MTVPEHICSRVRRGRRAARPPDAVGPRVGRGVVTLARATSPGSRRCSRRVTVRHTHLPEWMPRVAGTSRQRGAGRRRRTGGGM